VWVTEGVRVGKCTDQRPGGDKEQRSSWCRHGLLTIKLLNAPEIIIRQHEVLCVHPLVERCHDG
jgi:hypothetical protein